MVFVLLHSLLTGPGVWSRVAEELKRRGYDAIAPSLLGPGGAPRDWREAADAATAAVEASSDPVVLVGHSGGGLLLPVVADAVGPHVSGLVFVDSAVPASAGETPLAPAPLLDDLRALAVDGTLPPWSTWFGEDAMRRLVPDDGLRAMLEREMPSIPLAYLEQSIPSPTGWDRVPCAYLRLSDAYRDAGNEAKARGWRVDEISGAEHLHIAVAPDAVTDELIRLTEA